MTCDSLGRPICPKCQLPIRRARRVSQDSFVFACEPCVIEEVVPISQLRVDRQEDQRAA